jgi:signal transduction histidine kinase
MHAQSVPPNASEGLMEPSFAMRMHERPGIAGSGDFALNNMPLQQLAHELRTPLNAIGFAMEVLRMAPERIAREQALDIMERQLQVLTRLGDDLFHAARGGGDLPSRRYVVSLDLNAVARDAIESCQAALAQRGHHVVTMLAERLPSIEGDLIRLRQVVTNLLHNARKYTPPGGRIVVRTSLERGQAVLRVQDNGMGIARRELHPIFESFRQLDPKARSTGLGLGLALVSTWVAAHHGTVEVHSDGVGKGSMFTVRLPLRQQRMGAASTEATHRRLAHQVNA